jgi:hypothetical protein
MHKNIRSTPTARRTARALSAAAVCTRDSNVYRIPSGPGDTYSSTTLFDGSIGRSAVGGSSAGPA